MPRLAGKVAIVTGAAPRREGLGIGKATAIMFAREGASVVLVNRRLAAAETLAEEINQAGGRAVAHQADLTQDEAAASVAQCAIDRFGRIDILINNVGFAHYSRITDINRQTWEDSFHANLTTAMLSSKYCIEHMLAKGGGAIVNISSIAGEVGPITSHGLISYATMKAGLGGLTRATAADHAAAGIRCNCLVVGPVNTPMVAHLGQEALDRRRLAVPLQTEGTAWDVAYAALYLASDEARWVTGVSLPIDGGFLNARNWPR